MLLCKYAPPDLVIHSIHSNLHINVLKEIIMFLHFTQNFLHWIFRNGCHGSFNLNMKNLILWGFNIKFCCIIRDIKSGPDYINRLQGHPEAM
jgi:hypothetical protein